MNSARSFRTGLLLGLLALLVSGCATLPLNPFAPGQDGYARHVVTIRATHQDWNEDRPWTKRNPSTREAAGVVVGPGLVLTRAFAIADATLIQAEKRGGSRQTEARVVHVDPEIDLALVAIDEADYFDDLDPAPLAKASPADGSVKTVRWRKRQLEVAETPVSRVEVLSNRYGNVEHAFLLVSSSLESAGWGEPVFSGGKLAGLTISHSDGRGWVMPVEIIRSYLERAGDAESYQGFAKLGVVWQNSEDDALADYLGLQGPPRGVLIRSVRRGSSACGRLQPRDILLELDGHEIDAIGNYEHPRYGRLRFTHLAVGERAPGDSIRAKVLRDGAVQEFDIELRSYPSALRRVRWRRDNEAPPYLMAGGLVFRELDGPFLLTWGKGWSRKAPSGLVTTYHLDAHSQTPEDRRIIVLSGVLPDRYNLGYHDVSNLEVKSVNGRAIDSVRDVAEALTLPEGDQHVIELIPNGQLAEIVLDAAQLPEATLRIQEAYRVPRALRLPSDELPEVGPPCE